MAHVENRTRRAKLSAGKRHWHVLEKKLAVGYRRPERGGAGSWYVRALIGEEHKMAALGTADDAEGVGMNWSQAQAKAREWFQKQTSTGPLAVETAVREYADDLRARKGDRAACELIGRMQKHLFPALGARQLVDLTTAELIIRVTKKRPDARVTPRTACLRWPRRRSTMPSRTGRSRTIASGVG
jgi:hypothetical protein